MWGWGGEGCQPLGGGWGVPRVGSWVLGGQPRFYQALTNLEERE